MEYFRHVIGGELVDAADGATFETIDPHTGRAYATVAEGGAEDVARAVGAARRAFDEGPWPRMPVMKRRMLLNQLAMAFKERVEEFAAAETRDVGKPVRESRGYDMPRVELQLRFFADQPFFTPGETHELPGYHTFTTYAPKGVVAAISPWNFPLMLATWKIAPALGFGNTVVLKPAEQSPATATMLAELAAEILPPGVLNVVHGFGPDAAGEHLVRHPGVDLVTFTGESVTGTKVMEAAAPTLKGVSLELGGKSPNIVFADADVDAALDGAVEGIFKNQGEVCLATSRLFVERPLYDEFVSRLAERAGKLPVGDPRDTETVIGPLVSAEHLERVSRYLQIAEEDGGKVLVGGGRPDDPALADGYYLEPTILTNLPHDSACNQEEIFGPVLTATPFHDEAEAVDWANDTRYGLAGMVWTRDLERAHRVSSAISAGTVWVNCVYVRDPRAPFGGTKASGIGREGGVHSREFFTEPKTVTMKVGPTPPMP
jgi:aminomuconate-semialdehyde/2-hydroxymuconate-6-semialdehyde dehydrogenase